MKNIFVVGADDFNCKLLQDLYADKGHEFHSLLTFDEVKGDGDYPPFDRLIDQAESVLKTFPGSVDAIVGWWDFPVNSMVPILCDKHQLTSPSLESELKCDHKYWSRYEQSNVIPEHTPAFETVDPFADNAAGNIRMKFPFWIKPVKSTDSFLAFKVDNEEELQRVLERTRQRIGSIGGPFNELLTHARLPEHVAEIDGNHCIVEEMIGGHQCTVEGHVYEGEVTAHGVIDSFKYPGVSPFFRYEYPSRLPQQVKDDIIATSEKFMSHIGFDNGCFNIEYFYDADSGTYKLLEINPRISQSHSEMFKYVDGSSNQRIMVDLALGDKPRFEPRAGEYACAAKFYLRRFQDGKVSRAPGPVEIDKLRSGFKGVDIDVNVEAGTQLSKMIEQDSYSYDIAHIYVGASNTDDLIAKFRQVVESLDIRFEGEDGDDWKQAALEAE